MKSKKSLCVIAFLMASLVYGCGEDGLGSASVSATVAGLSADEVTAIQITVSGANISPDIVSDLTKDTGTGDWSGTIENIPAGTNRTFLAEASNASAEVVYSGSATGVTVIDGQQVVVNLFLQQTTPPNPFVNTVPIFDSLVLSSAQVSPGNDVTLTVAVTDPDPGDILTLLWTATGGSFNATNTASVVWTAPATEGAYSLTVAVSDSTGATSTLTVTIDVGVQFGSGSASIQVELNTWPVVQKLLPTPTRIDEGESTQLNLTAFDPDGDILAYSWSADCVGTFIPTDDEDPSFTLDADNAGAPCSLTVALDDGRGGSNTASISIATGPPISTSPAAPLSFGPALSFVNAGVGLTATYPDPLTVRLTEPTEVDTPVTVTSELPAALVAYDVTIPSGSDSAVVFLDGLVASAPIDVTANVNGIEMTAQVRVLDGNETPALFALSPSRVEAAPGADVEFAVVLDVPAPAGGTIVDLTYSGGGSGPASVSILAGDNTASFFFTAGAAGTNSSITASLGLDTRSAIVTVAEFPPRTIFVSAAPFGQDHAACGTAQLAPCATITYGIGRCQEQNCPQVVVSSGLYTESIYLVPGISVLGGYNEGFSMRDIATWRPVMRGDPTTTATVTAVNISNSTTFEGFIVFAPSTNDPSADSIGIKVVNSNATLLIQNNLIYGGVAGDGADRQPGAPGVNGVAGGDGAEALPLYTYDLDPGPLPGGSGGGQIIGATNVSGGEGGASVYPQFDAPTGNGSPCGTPGVIGQGLNGGLGGEAGYCGWIQQLGCGGVLLPTNGPFHGSDGSDGASGPSGVGGLGGVAGIGPATAGADGGDGEPGAGAGGGGPGGGAAAHPSCDAVGPMVFYGPSGGGGGSGADGGKGGLGGGGGGRSFGIFIQSVGVPTIVGNEIYLGIGGDGRQGGAGGPGGIGGVGGQGVLNPASWATGIPGNGGLGGNGGHGGGGGGGAGGLSVGIVANFDATGSYEVDNVIHVSTGRAGQGGYGGFSLAAPGQDGQDGLVLAILYQ